MPTFNRLVGVSAGLAIALTLHGCGSSTDVDGKCATDGTDYSYKESVSGDTRSITTSHCPNHPFDSSYNPNLPIKGEKSYSFPAKPMINTKTTDLTEQGAAVGLYFSGAISFSPYGGPSYGKVTSQEQSAASVEGDTFDMCGCHSSSSDTESYHCHIAPSCLMQQLDPSGNTTQHSPHLGYAADGFPMYGPRGPDGTLMKRCSIGLVVNPEPCVDDCGGRESTEPSDGFTYRYYHLGNVNDGLQCGGPATAIGDYLDVFGFVGDTNKPPNEEFYPNSPICYKGCCPDGATCSFSFIPACESDAKTGISGSTPAAPHPDGLAKNPDACWKDSTN